MSGSLCKRILKWALFVTPWLLALGLAVGWGLAEWTPGYLERLVPRLAADMGVPVSEFHIRDAGLFSADVGPVRIGSENKGLKLNNVRVTYTPASLKQKRVNDIILDGASLSCAYDGKTFSLPILDLLPKSDNTTSDNTLPALPMDSIVIRDSILHCDYNGKDFSIPFTAEITPGETIRFKAILRPRDQKIAISGELGPSSNDLTLKIDSKKFRLGALNDLLPLPLGGILDLALTTTMDLSRPDDAHAEIDLTVTEPAIPNTDVVFADGTALNLHATLSQKGVTFSLAPISVEAPSPATLSITDGHASADSLFADFTASAMGVELPGQVTAQQSDDGWKISLTAANPERLALTTGGRTIRLAGFDFSMKGKVSPNMADVTVQTSTRGATLDGTDLRCGTAKALLPLKWPAPKTHTPGSLRISGLRYGKYALGTASASLRQKGMGLGLNGALYTKLLPDLKIPFSGQAAMDGPFAEFFFGIDRYDLPETFDPATLLPDVKNLRLSGTLAVDGGVRLDKGDIDSRIGVFFTGGTMSIGQDENTGEPGTTMTGVRLFFESPDLLDFRSAPAQVFAFDTLKSGPVFMRNGRLTFQLERRGVVLVERLHLNWCGGKVESRAFRIVPGLDEYDVTMFCSQLRLSSLLGQLGLAEAEGEAALSGELPITWNKGKISFNNGFLHSTPGQGGTLKVEAMQDIVSSMPEGTPQRAQLELAQAAIRNYQYKWVRIKADTVGEDLLVRLSVDGKPGSVLPFVYNKEFGGFAKVTGDFAGSNFQGLRLDVNFSLPLDRILLYKDIIGMIE